VELAIVAFALWFLWVHIKRRKKHAAVSGQ
jgi:hypothetical protein